VELVWRSLTTADIPAVTALHTTAEAADDLLSEEDFAETDEAGQQLPSDAVAAVRRVHRAVESLGFSADRHFCDLEVALGESLAQVPIPHGYEIVPFSATRAEEVRQVCNAAFAAHRGSADRSPQEWAASFTNSRRFVPETSFLAL